MTDQNANTSNTNNASVAAHDQNAPVAEYAVSTAAEPMQATASQTPCIDATPIQPGPAASMGDVASQASPVPPMAGAAPQSAPVPPAGNTPPQSAFVPPAVGTPSQSGYASIPQNIPGMPLVQLTGGMKFGWAAAGFLMGPIAILLAWLTNAHNFPEVKKDAVKFSLFGFLAQFLIWFVLIALFGCATCAAVTSAATSYPYYY